MRKDKQKMLLRHVMKIHITSPGAHYQGIANEAACLYHGSLRTLHCEVL